MECAQGQSSVTTTISLMVMAAALCARWNWVGNAAVIILCQIHAAQTVGTGFDKVLKRVMMGMR
jgi:hypothetical protein